MSNQEAEDEERRMEQVDYHNDIISCFAGISGYWLDTICLPTFWNRKGELLSMSLEQRLGVCSRVASADRVPYVDVCEAIPQPIRGVICRECWIFTPHLRQSFCEDPGRDHCLETFPLALDAVEVLSLPRDGLLRWFPTKQETSLSIPSAGEGEYLPLSKTRTYPRPRNVSRGRYNAKSIKLELVITNPYGIHIRAVQHSIWPIVSSPPKQLVRSRPAGCCT